MLDWLKLVRVSGLFTIVSNLTAAVLMAVYASEALDLRILAKRFAQGGEIRVLWVIAASFLLYLSGMIWNDLADVDRDRTLHPRRPLPSGRINLAAAYVAGVVFAVGALLCAAMVDLQRAPQHGPPHAFYAAGVVLSLIFLYNLVTKDVPYLGSLTMALVRFAHAIFALLLLGPDYLQLAVLGPVAAPGQGYLLVYPLVLGAYILGVTLISELESRAGRRVELLIGGALVFGAILAAGVLLVRAHWLPRITQGDGALQVVGMAMAFGLGAVLFVWLLRSVAKPYLAALRDGRAALVGPVVGAALGGIMLLDALVATSAHPLGGLLILLLVPFFMLTRRVVRMD
ncbi:MAG: UbiA family prenyltransferase [Planctomycetes bacterium]|nr:UbiA family prenyltransferase [Planctomycetota bacterium]